MGKRQVGELQPSELVVAIMISDLATIPMSDSAIPLANGIIPILTLIASEIVASICALKSPKIRKILTGAPSVIIRNGKIDRKEMSKNRYNLEDLAEALRMKDYFSFDDVYMAILETNGTLSVIPKSPKRTPTAEELNLPENQETLPFVLIADGKVYPKHLKEAGVNEDWLKKELKKRDIKNVKEVFLMTVNSNGQIGVQKRE